MKHDLASEKYNTVDLSIEPFVTLLTNRSSRLRVGQVCAFCAAVLHSVAVGGFLSETTLN